MTAASIQSHWCEFVPIRVRVSEVMRTRAKLGSAALSVLALTVGPVVGEQRLVTSERTVNTPAGRFGLWKISEMDGGYARNDYWLLFGRLGKWHLRTLHQGRTSLLPVVFVSSVVVALVITAKQRNMQGNGYEIRPEP